MGGSKKKSSKGKSGKSGKSGKKSKGKKGSEASSKKGKKNAQQENETNTKTGEARFTFLNRDVYEGQFKITTIPQNNIYRLGAGTYKTHDGQTYVGQWDQDILKDEVEITYKDGGKYIGHVEEMKYTGQGRYEFPDGSAIACTFVADRPVGEMFLIDPTGHEWRGLAAETDASFIPLNRFLPIGPTTVPSDEKQPADSLQQQLREQSGSRASVKSRKSSKEGRGSLDRRSTSPVKRSSRSRTSSISPPTSPPPTSPPPTALEKEEKK